MSSVKEEKNSNIENCENIENAQNLGDVITDVKITDLNENDNFERQSFGNVSRQSIAMTEQKYIPTSIHEQGKSPYAKNQEFSFSKRERHERNLKVAQTAENSPDCQRSRSPLRKMMFGANDSKMEVSRSFALRKEPMQSSQTIQNKENPKHSVSFKLDDDQEGRFQNHAQYNMSDQEIQNVKSKYGWVPERRSQNSTNVSVKAESREYKISDFRDGQRQSSTYIRDQDEPQPKKVKSPLRHQRQNSSRSNHQQEDFRFGTNGSHMKTYDNRMETKIVNKMLESTFERNRVQDMRNYKALSDVVIDQPTEYIEYHTVNEETNQRPKYYIEHQNVSPQHQRREKEPIQIREQPPSKQVQYAEKSRATPSRDYKPATFTPQRDQQMDMYQTVQHPPREYSHDASLQRRRNQLQPDPYRKRDYSNGSEHKGLVVNKLSKYITVQDQEPPRKMSAAHQSFDEWKFSCQMDLKQEHQSQPWVPSASDNSTHSSMQQDRCLKPLRQGSPIREQVIKTPQGSQPREYVQKERQYSPLREQGRIESQGSVIREHDKRVSQGSPLREQGARYSTQMSSYSNMQEDRIKPTISIIQTTSDYVVARSSTTNNQRSPLREQGKRQSAQISQNLILEEDRRRPSMVSSHNYQDYPVARSSATNKQGSPLRGKTFNFKEQSIQSSHCVVSTPRSRSTQQEFRSSLAQRQSEFDFVSILERTRATQQELHTLHLLKPNNPVYMNFGKFQSTANQEKIQQMPPMAQQFLSEVSLQHEWMAKNVIMLMNQLCQERLANGQNQM